MSTSATVLGTIGTPWRASVDDGARIALAGHSMEFAVAADDRWHRVALEPSRRQHSVEGTPVVETRVRVPGGDVVLTTYAVVAGGGMVVIEARNDSSMPVALACSDPSVISSRPAAEVPIVGIDLPTGSVVFPIGHRSSIRLGFAMDRSITGVGGAAALASAPDPAAVVRGWRRQCEVSGRLQLPDHGDESIAQRCVLLLDGVEQTLERYGPDPVDLLLALGESVRMGAPAAAWVETAAEAAMIVGRRHRDDPQARQALLAAAQVFAMAGEHWAVADAEAMLRAVTGWGPAAAGDQPVGGPRFLGWLRSRLVEEISPDGGLAVFPVWPSHWLGQAAEVHGLFTLRGKVSAAIRWHGERPALLWERIGPYRGALRCPGLDPEWSSTQDRGDALLAVVDPLLPIAAVSDAGRDAADVTGVTMAVQLRPRTVEPPR